MELKILEFMSREAGVSRRCFEALKVNPKVYPKVGAKKQEREKEKEKEKGCLHP